MGAAILENMPVTCSEDSTLFREISRFVLTERPLAWDFAKFRAKCYGRTHAKNKTIPTPTPDSTDNYHWFLTLGGATRSMAVVAGAAATPLTRGRRTPGPSWVCCLTATRSSGWQSTLSSTATDSVEAERTRLADTLPTLTQRQNETRVATKNLSMVYSMITRGKTYGVCVCVCVLFKAA